MRAGLVSALAAWAERIGGARSALANCLVCSVLVASVYAEPRAELVARMETLRESIAQEQVAADAAQSKSEQINKALKTIKSEIVKLKREEQDLSANLAKLEKSQSTSELERTRLLSEQTLIKARLIERIRAVYLVPKSSALASLVSSQHTANFGLINRYLEAVYLHDTELAKKLNDLAAQIATRGNSIRSLLMKQKSVANDLRLRREKVAERLAAQERVATEAKIEQSRREIAVASLRAKLLRFESTLTGLTGGTYEVMEGETSTSRQVDESFDGPGLRKNSSAPMPVSGRVVTRFGGKRRDGQVSKGFEIDAAGLSAVKAVGQGRVVFVGELPGLGIVVVIDHGERMFSLYGRLANARCSNGNVVELREVLGEANGDKPVYFEVRQGGVAVDPRAFISLS